MPPVTFQSPEPIDNRRNARINVAHFVRALHAEGHACTAEQAVRIVKLIVRAVAELKAIGIDKRVRGLDLRLDVEEARDVEAPTDLAERLSATLSIEPFLPPSTVMSVLAEARRPTTSTNWPASPIHRP